ncbi:hypothetical protein BDN67DRAFT_982529 [Paxillus ammoniavirescens]|nr:hypothetical protein BDN67DRAFT_982529 [Paxillus ammoniavirescens]
MVQVNITPESFRPYPTPDEARTSIDWIASVVPKVYCTVTADPFHMFVHCKEPQVRDNHVDFRRTSERLLYLLQAIEEGRRTGAAPAHSLDAAMLALLHLVKRAERIIRMELQRSLGDRTWNRSEIRAALDRLRTDIDQYLGSQVVSALSESGEAVAYSGWEIMTVLAQLNEKENMNATCLETISNAAHVQNETNLIRGGSAQDFTIQNFVSIGGQAKRTIDMLARFRYQMTTAKVVIKGLKLRHDGSFSSGSRPTTTDLAIPLATPGASPEINNVILEPNFSISGM